MTLETGTLYPWEGSAKEFLLKPLACERCRKIHGGDRKAMAPMIPSHLKAICWAHLCEACAMIVVKHMVANWKRKLQVTTVSKAKDESEEL